MILIFVNEKGPAMKVFDREIELFSRYLQTKGLKVTDQRSALLRTFLEHDGHLAAEDLHHKARKHQPGIGFATVYRTLKHLVECGVARELDLGDGKVHYEPEFNHGHHDHLVCTSCGAYVEFFNPQIEQLQEKVYRDHGYRVTNHHMMLYGLCPKCQKGKAAVGGRA